MIQLIYECALDKRVNAPILIHTDGGTYEFSNGRISEGKKTVRHHNSPNVSRSINVGGRIVELDFDRVGGDITSAIIERTRSHDVVTDRGGREDGFLSLYSQYFDWVMEIELAESPEDPDKYSLIMDLIPCFGTKEANLNAIENLSSLNQERILDITDYGRLFDKNVNPDLERQWESVLSRGVSWYEIYKSLFTTQDKLPYFASVMEGVEYQGAFIDHRSEHIDTIYKALINDGMEFKPPKEHPYHTDRGLPRDNITIKHWGNCWYIDRAEYHRGHYPLFKRSIYTALNSLKIGGVDHSNGSIVKQNPKGYTLALLCKHDARLNTPHWILFETDTFTSVDITEHIATDMLRLGSSRICFSSAYVTSKKVLPGTEARMINTVFKQHNLSLSACQQMYRERFLPLLNQVGDLTLSDDSGGELTQAHELDGSLEIL